MPRSVTAGAHFERVKAALRDRYQLERELGSGGMATVFLAEDLKHRRRVGLKVLLPAVAEVLGPERFLREIEIAAKLTHPHILSLYDSGEADGFLYYVMPFIEGGSLRERLMRDERLPIPEAVRLVSEILDALAYAHGQGVVHRDIKPDNVMLSGRHALVTDFGIAKALSEVTGPQPVTAFGLVVGTPRYMAPEQAAGYPHVDHRADLYAVGVMAYEMLAGRPPFLGPSAPQLLLAQMNESAEPVERLAPGIPAHLASAVMRCLAKNPSDRWQSATELLLELERNEPPTPAALPSRVPPARPSGGRRPRVSIAELRWRRVFPARDGANGSSQMPATGTGALTFLAFRTRFRKSPWAIVLAIALGLGLGGFMVWRWPRHAEPVPSIAVLPFANLSAEHETDFLADGIAEEILGALAHVDGLHVTGRTSSFSFKGKNEDLRAIGQKLNVANVLEGSVRKSGTRLRISAQIVNAADGYQLWSQTFDRELADVFAVQDDIAHAVVAALQVRVLPGRPALAHEQRTASPEAYTQFLLGLQFQNQGSSTGLRRAIDAYERSIELDSEYAPAHARLAEAITVFRNIFETLSHEEDIRYDRRAQAEVERAVVLAPNLVDGYASRGWMRTFTFDWAGAREDLERAVALSPGSAVAQQRYGHLMAVLGRLPEAIAITQKAIGIEPLDSRAHYFLATYYDGSGELTLARAALKEALEIAPEYPLAARELGFNALLDGRPGDALTVFEAIQVEWIRNLGASLANHDLGHARESQLALDWLIAHNRDTSQYQIAEAYAWRGQLDLAFEWLERARVEHDPGTRYVKYDPLLRRLRGDPRFSAFLTRLGLPTG